MNQTSLFEVKKTNVKKVDITKKKSESKAAFEEYVHKILG